jgi:hypothetical protein
MTARISHISPVEASRCSLWSWCLHASHDAGLDHFLHRLGGNIVGFLMKALRELAQRGARRLDHVRELLKLDRAYYCTTDDGVLRETVSKLTIAGIQVLKRPKISTSS